MLSWKRVMICDCVNNIDRDRNSYINIMLRFLSQNALSMGYQQFIDNLRQYRIPYGSQILEHMKELLDGSLFLGVHQSDRDG
jgi:putative transposase